MEALGVSVELSIFGRGIIIYLIHYICNSPMRAIPATHVTSNQTLNCMVGEILNQGGEGASKSLNAAAIDNYKNFFEDNLRTKACSPGSSL